LGKFSNLLGTETRVSQNKASKNEDSETASSKWDYEIQLERLKTRLFSVKSDFMKRLPDVKWEKVTALKDLFKLKGKFDKVTSE
jgi:hypothetical protein